MKIKLKNIAIYTLISIALLLLGCLIKVGAGFTNSGIISFYGIEIVGLCVIVFITVLLISKYVSLSSIAAAFTYPIGVTFVFPTPIRSIVIYGMCICVLVLVTHQKNIERLIRGKESKVNFFKKKTTTA